MTTTTAKHSRPAAQRESPPSPPPDSPRSLPGKLRELLDELVFVCAIVMFMKMFLVELYQIPTGSMTPTLLGGMVANVDADRDGRKDLVYWEALGSGWMLDRSEVFLNNGRRLALAPGMRAGHEQTRLWQAGGELHNVYDRILVDKLVYWFRRPKRGEVVVFKVPEPTFRIEAPIYIKRLVGEPGETITFLPDPATGGELAHLVVNGQSVQSPDFFSYWRYRPSVDSKAQDCLDLPFVHYFDLPEGFRRLDRIDVPPDQVFVLGDNTDGSLDSRYWGGVPLDNLRGRAFMRVWPFSRIGYIH